MLSSIKFTLVFLLVVTSALAHALETKFLRMNLPGGWIEAPKQFGSDAILTDLIPPHKQPLILYVRTYERSLPKKDCQTFLEGEVLDEPQAKSKEASKLKIVGKSSLKIAGSSACDVETSYFDTKFNEERGSFYVIISREKMYHYIEYSAPAELFKNHLPEVQEAIRNLELK